MLICCGVRGDAAEERSVQHGNGEAKGLSHESVSSREGMKSSV